MDAKELAHRLRRKVESMTAAFHFPSDVQKDDTTARQRYAFTAYGNDRSVYYVTVTEIKGPNTPEQEGGAHAD